ncbi:TetR family transcriptional regulator [Kitasatospora sp. NBC_01287]|uniref:TetR/AcrR family transcriptional regulator n=1 Tax=Kitasatospora sp. NBC_01287 TaxID=2903573 RepID=UPI00224D4D3C|nr:TetR family transcriptional regulator [Kitasatospora sp. NBC_01287]MCX4744770.1 TetR family transcriptional regulator [Kitasatospora sp. NBC_01287]
MSGRGPRGERGEQADKIVAAARRSFATRGYAATSLRSVAQDAGVDPGLVHYYFQGKTALLEAVMQPPEAFGAAVAAAAEQPLHQRGRAFVQATLRLWEDPAPAEILRSIILTAAQEPAAMQRLRQLFSELVLAVVSHGLPDTERTLRASLIATQIVGMVMNRYIWQVGDIATLPADTVTDLLAPTIQHYLADPLPTTLRDHSGLG